MLTAYIIDKKEGFVKGFGGFFKDLGENVRKRREGVGGVVQVAQTEEIRERVPTCRQADFIACDFIHRRWISSATADFIFFTHGFHPTSPYKTNFPFKMSFALRMRSS